MALTEQQALAGLRVLVCVAKADGVLHDEEKKSLVAALEGVKLPGGTTLDGLLEEKNEVDELAKALGDDEARLETLKSAYGMAHADGNCSDDEQALLDKLQKAFSVSDDETAKIKSMFASAALGGDVAGGGHVQKIEDDMEREAKIKSETMKCALVSAVLGAFPIPGIAIATDLAVVGLQVGLVRDIGAMWGRTLEKKEARGLLLKLGVGTGARLAVNNLAKLLPGWGSAVGATTSFASTFAIGRTMDAHFARGERSDMDALTNEFKEAEKEGKKAFDENKADFEKKKRESEAHVKELSTELKKGRISQDDYERRVSQLPG